MVLEAAPAVGHVRSGSKGSARIFRLGYPEPHYVDMALQAEALWRDLEEATGRTLLRVTGQVSFGDEVALAAIEAGLAARGRATEALSADDVTRRFPGFATAGPALVEPDSGVLAADECLAALRAAGNFEVATDWRVASLDEGPDVALVTTARGDVLEADVVVNCAGPLALSLLPGHPRPAVEASPSVPQVAYFRTADADADARLPVFIEWGPDMIYGLPVLGAGAQGGLYKVSHHTPGPALTRFDPTDPADWPDEPALLAELTWAVQRFLPTLDPVPVATERCVYDNSTDQDFVLDRIGRVVVGCGTSGHGFKFGPLLGEVLADLAEGQPPPVDVTRFRLGRSKSTRAGTVTESG